MSARPLLYRRAILALVFALPTVVAAQVPPESKVSVHGYLTQGSGFSSNLPTFGLTKDGTADYRRAAVLVLYAATPANRFVVQLGHRRLGDSPAMQFEDNVKVDMAFFEHRFGTGTTVRVGKTAMPFGIYNEFRYAGHLLPFYRAPISVYWEGTYTNESIDGVVLEHHFRDGQAWELATQVFGGTYRLLEFGTVPTGPTSTAYMGLPLEAKQAIGTQLWLTTPVDGLRVGGNFRYHTDVGGLYPRGSGVAAREWNASIDGSFEKWQIRAEGLRSSSIGAVLLSRYAQLGLRPTDLVSLNLQADVAKIETGPVGAKYTIKFWQDYAAGVNFHLAPLMVLKLEAHKSRGFLYETPSNINGTPLKSSYYIASFSVTF